MEHGAVYFLSGENVCLLRHGYLGVAPSAGGTPYIAYAMQRSPHINIYTYRNAFVHAVGAEDLFRVDGGKTK